MALRITGESTGNHFGDKKGKKGVFVSWEFFSGQTFLPHSSRLISEAFLSLYALI